MATASFSANSGFLSTVSSTLLAAAKHPGNFYGTCWIRSSTHTLNRFAPQVLFDPVITADDVKNPKPAPDGLHLIQSRHPGKSIWYLGDTVDDARASKGAGVPFIGVAAKNSPRYQELVEVLTQQGAFTVLSDINELLHLFPESGGMR